MVHMARMIAESMFLESEHTSIQISDAFCLDTYTCHWKSICYMCRKVYSPEQSYMRVWAMARSIRKNSSRISPD